VASISRGLRDQKGGTDGSERISAGHVLDLGQQRLGLLLGGRGHLARDVADLRGDRRTDILSRLVRLAACRRGEPRQGLLDRGHVLAQLGNIVGQTVARRTGRGRDAGPAALEGVGDVVLQSVDTTGCAAGAEIILLRPGSAREG
jgi:hypothetical protein